MGKTISVYIDDDLLKMIKERDIPVSSVIRDALKEWFGRETREKDYDSLEISLYGIMSAKGKKAWKELLEERDRW